MQHLHFFEPRRRGRAMPLALFLHSATGHARMFHNDVSSLLERGFACASLEAPFARSRNVIQPRGLLSPRNERSLWDRTSEELSLALEESLDRWKCDPGRVAFLGLGIGGCMGAYWMARGASAHLGAAVLMAAPPDLTDLLLQESASEKEAQLYEDRMRETDLVLTLEVIQKIPVLAQYGLQDPGIPASSRAKIEALAGGRKNISISLVDDDQEMRNGGSVRQRAKFLEDAFAL